MYLLQRPECKCNARPSGPAGPSPSAALTVLLLRVGGLVVLWVVPVQVHDLGQHVEHAGPVVVQGRHLAANQLQPLQALQAPLGTEDRGTTLSHVTVSLLSVGMDGKQREDSLWIKRPPAGKNQQRSYSKQGRWI